MGQARSHPGIFRKQFLFKGFGDALTQYCRASLQEARNDTKIGTRGNVLLERLFGLANETQAIIAAINGFGNFVSKHMQERPRQGYSVFREQLRE